MSEQIIRKAYEVVVRDLDDAVVKIFEKRAAVRGISLEQQLRDVLVAAAEPTREEILAELDEIRAMTKPGDFPLAEDMIREDRDSR